MGRLMFIFLWLSQAAAPKVGEFDPHVYLCQGDIWVDSHKNPTFLQIQIKASKTDPFLRHGVTVYVRATGAELCPVTAIINYMMTRGTKPGPSFIRSDGSYMTRDYFVTAVRAALSEAGFAAKNYAGHSFWIGAATTAAQQGLQDSLIKTLGTWQSLAYTRYIRTPRDTLTKVARALVTSKEH